MNKLLLSLLCVFVISCGLSCVCACEDMGNATMNHDFIQNDVQQVIAEDIDVTVDENSTASETVNVAADDNSTVQVNETQLNGTSNAIVNKTTYKLNITDPKDFNHSTKIYETPDALLLYCANLCKKYPDLTMGEIVNAFDKEHWDLVSHIIPKAYDLALKEKGSEMRYPNGISEQDVLNLIIVYEQLPTFINLLLSCLN